jgi:hypothetical protein
MAEQISVIENNRIITPDVVYKYLPNSKESNLPVLVNDLKNTEQNHKRKGHSLYKILFDMKKDVTDLKKIVVEILRNGQISGDFP